MSEIVYAITHSFAGWLIIIALAVFVIGTIARLFGKGDDE